MWIADQTMLSIIEIIFNKRVPRHMFRSPVQIIRDRWAKKKWRGDPYVSACVYEGNTKSIKISIVSTTFLSS